MSTNQLNLFRSIYFERVGVTPGGRPKLDYDEYVIRIAFSTGLYQDDFKIKGYQNGRLYLTNRRVIFIEETSESESVGINILHIDQLDYYSGFLKSSPKIVLKLKHQPEVLSMKKSDRKMLSISWVCPICSFSNDFTTTLSNLDMMRSNGSSLPTCENCGISSTFELLKKSMAHKKQQETPGVVDLMTFNESECPKCTFINHPSMVQCEICGTDLPNLWSNSFVDSENNPLVSKSPINLMTLEPYKSIDLNVVKISFRKGGHSEVYEDLKRIIENNDEHSNKIKNEANLLESKQIGNFSSFKGIHGLANKSEQQNQEASLLLSKSLQDLEQLLSKAEELIDLSKKYQLLMKNMKPGGEKDINFTLLSESRKSVTKLQDIMQNDQIQKSINKTKNINSLNSLKKCKSTTKVSGMPLEYIKELSRSIYDFLTDENILDKNNGLVTMFELYSLYNNSRQVNLVTPEEFFGAVVKFEEIGDGLAVSKVSTVRKEYKNDADTIDGGAFIYVISKKNGSKDVNRKVFLTVSSNPGIRIMEIQAHIQVNYLILKSILNALVNDGSLTIDESIEGCTYWPNEILEANALNADVSTNNLSFPKCDSTMDKGEKADGLPKNSKITVTQNNNIGNSEWYKELRNLDFS